MIVTMFVLQPLMQNKSKFTVNFNLKPREHTSKMYCLWLVTGMPKLEIVGAKCRWKVGLKIVGLKMESGT